MSNACIIGRISKISINSKPVMTLLYVFSLTLHKKSGTKAYIASADMLHAEEEKAENSCCKHHKNTFQKRHYTSQRESVYGTENRQRGKAKARRIPERNRRRVSVAAFPSARRKPVACDASHLRTCGQSCGAHKQLRIGRQEESRK